MAEKTNGARQATAKRKYYVVWEGVTPGVYDTWGDCLLQVKGYGNAKYKSFGSLEEAREAYCAGAYSDHLSGSSKSGKAVSSALKKSAKASGSCPCGRHIAVDAACSGNPGAMEYRGVNIETGAVLFQYKAKLGTNNIGEYLAIVHALAMIDREGWEGMAVYSDSKTAMGWVVKKACNTKLERNEKTENLFRVIERADSWLQTHPLHATVRKWKTKDWGEIPADFGRK